MVKHVLFVLVLWFFTLPQGDADDARKKELAQLEGTWTLIKAEMNGKSVLEKDDKPKLMVKDGKWTNGPKAAMKLSEILDPSKKPKTVTFPYEEAVFYGIYEVNGDELRVCGDGVDTGREKNPEARRPKEFDSTKGVLLVFKREKK